MAHTKLKLCVVVAGIGWSLLLVYVMSSLNWGPGDTTDAHRRSANIQQAENIPLARAAKSHVLLGELIEASKRGNKTQGRAADTPHLPPQLHQLPNRPNTTSPAGKVNLVMSGDATSLIGAVAAMNSIVSNTRAPVHFHITLPRAVIPDFRMWVQKTKLHKTECTLMPHPSQLPVGKPHFAKVYILAIFPHLEGRFIYLPPDVIVQGDISELVEMNLKTGSYGAFGEDCQSLGHHRQGSSSRPFYAWHLNLRHPRLRSRGIKPAACTFDTDVFVADVAMWRTANVTGQLTTWVNASTNSDHLYGNDPEADASEAAMLVTMYRHTSPLPRLWHHAGLGLSPGAGYSQAYVNAAKLLRWDGPFKPWGRRAAFSDVWFRYAIPDPQNKYRPKKAFT